MVTNCCTLAEYQCSFQVPQELRFLPRDIGSGNRQRTGVRPHGAESRGYGSGIAMLFGDFPRGLIPLRVESWMGVGEMLHPFPQFLFQLELGLVQFVARVLYGNVCHVWVCHG